MLTQQSLNDARDFLKGANIKVTLPRLFVLKALESVNVGVTAYDLEHILIEMNQRINLATIYSTLKLFQNMGLLQRSKTHSDQAVYFLNKSKTAIQFRCQQCGSSQCTDDDSIAQHIYTLCHSHQLNHIDYQVVIQIQSCQYCTTRLPNSYE